MEELFGLLIFFSFFLNIHSSEEELPKKSYDLEAKLVLNYMETLHKAINELNELPALKIQQLREHYRIERMKLNQERITQEKEIKRTSYEDKVKLLRDYLSRIQTINNILKNLVYEIDSRSSKIDKLSNDSKMKKEREEINELQKLKIYLNHEMFMLDSYLEQESMKN